MNKPNLPPAARLTLLYVIVGVLWNAVWDGILARQVADPAVRVVGDLGFVAAGSILFYFLVRRTLRISDEARLALAQERNLLRTVIDNIPDYIFVTDTASRFLLNNKAHLKELNAHSEAEV